jgi:hypothetical protein
MGKRRNKVGVTELIHAMMREHNYTCSRIDGFTRKYMWVVGYGWTALSGKSFSVKFPNRLKFTIVFPDKREDSSRFPSQHVDCHGEIYILNSNRHKMPGLSELGYFHRFSYYDPASTGAILDFAQDFERIAKMIPRNPLTSHLKERLSSSRPIHSDTSPD